MTIPPRALPARILLTDGFPSREYAINTAWLELALTGIDLLAWTQMLLLDGELAAAEPKKLRYRLLHVPARITRSARRTPTTVHERHHGDHGTGSPPDISLPKSPPQRQLSINR